MSEGNRYGMTMLLQSLQLITLVIGVAGLFLAVGRKDARLETNSSEIVELRDIASDLVKASIEATTTNRDQDRRLDDLRERIHRMELSK